MRVRRLESACEQLRVPCVMYWGFSSQDLKNDRHDEIFFFFLVTDLRYTYPTLKIHTLAMS